MGFFVYKHVYIIHQNINGLIGKSDMLVVCLDNLNDEGKHVDVLCITEHNMTQNDIDLLVIPDFKLLSWYCRPQRRGGSCILIRNDQRAINLLNIEKLSICNIFECSAIELTEHKIIIICLYRPPSNENKAEKLNIFLNNFENMLIQLWHKQKYKIIVCGDYNIDILKNSKDTKDFINLIDQYNLKIEFNEATRLSSMTCIDNIIHTIKGCKGEIIELALSDHTAQLLKVPVQKSCRLKHWYVYKRDYSIENRNKFKEYINKLPFNDVYSYECANLTFNKFHELLVLMYNLCFPTIKTKITTKRKLPWLSKGIKTCSKKKELCYGSRD